MIAIAKRDGESAARDQIVECLAECQAKNLHALSEVTGFAGSVIKKELDYLIKRREVEVLRPLPPSSGRWKEPGAADSSAAVHFRLIRDTDKDYLWEQGEVARFPASRMCHNSSNSFSGKSHRAAENRIPWLRRAASFGFAIPGL